MLQMCEFLTDDLLIWVNSAPTGRIHRLGHVMSCHVILCHDMTIRWNFDA